MSRSSMLAAVLSLAFPFAGMAQSTMQTASATTPVSDHEVRSLMKSAHNRAQYRTLSGYFHHREADYRAKAAVERIERDRRAQINAGLAQKYPRPIDSALYLYESYLSDADMAAALAQHYDQLATDPEQQHQEIVATSSGKS